jgi:molybdate transport system substrate-binding protein
MRRAAALLCLLVVGLVLAACSGNDTTTRKQAGEAGTATVPATSAATIQGDVTVFAASSLTDAFTEIGNGFMQAHPGVRVRFNFAASSTLRTQLEQGARADVFASADQIQMDSARKAGVLDGPDAIFVKNKLVVITPAANPGKIETVGDLARPGLKLVLTDKAVPIGAYARTSLEKMSADPAYGSDFGAKVLGNVRSEEANVRAVVTKVQLGEADAGIVYASDVTSAVAKDIRALPIPDQFNAIASYMIAVVRDAPNPVVAAAFIRHVRSPAAQDVLRRNNFFVDAETGSAWSPVADVPLRLVQQRAYSESFSVGGEVNAPRRYTLADLQALPSEESDVQFLGGGRLQQHSYTGVPLYDLLIAAEPRFDPDANNDALGWVIRVEATDGYVVVLGWGEIDPGFAGTRVLVAYAEDGEPLGETDGMARLVVPGDERGGRYVSNIASIRVQRAEGPAPVNIYHAGSLNSVLTRDIGPGFTAATGVPFAHTSGPSVGLANQIRAGQIQPDVFLSADAEVNNVLLGDANGNRARWYLTFARTRMVLAYSPASRFRADFEAAAAGERPWYEVLETPGLVWKRGDPRTDPGGYRGVFVFALAERYYGIPGLKDRLLQGDDNEAQIFAGDYQTVVRGEADAVVTYITNAIDNGLPYIQLPDEIDQSNLDLAAWYAGVAYTNPQGQTFRGTPAVYGMTIPTGARNPAGAAAFVRYLLSPPSREALAAAGFLPAAVLAGGDPAALPASLHDLIEGAYAP